MSTIPRQQRARPSWATLVVTAAAGIPAGVLWWLLAPAGLNLITRDPALGTGTNPLAWLPRDLTLAGLFLLAGCLVAAFLAGSKRPDPQTALVLGLAGSFCGAVLAWQTGLLAASLWGPAADPALNASVAFSLRAWPVILIWPAATAIAVFVLEIIQFPGRRPASGMMSGQDAPGPVK